MPLSPATLARCGYPLCPGDIMLTNPQWRQPLSEFKATVTDWLLGHLDQAMARDLTDALHFLMGLRLTNHLRLRQLGEPAHQQVRLSELGMLERDLLKDSLAIVKRFKQHLRTHFRLDAL